MIPFTFHPLVVLILLVCHFAILVLLVWIVLLTISSRVRANLKKNGLWSLLAAVLLLTVASPLIYMYVNDLIMSAVEEAKYKTVLKKATTIGDLTLPVGTQLELPNSYLIDEKWLKPEYFEKANFKKPVLWRGLSITSMRRYLHTQQDNFPESYKVTRITWGDSLETVLDKPHNIQGFYCKEKVEWRLLHSNDDENNSDYHDYDAAGNGPAYRVTSCFSAGQRITDSMNHIHIRIPKNSYISQRRWINKQLPKGYHDLWVINDDKTISTNLFELSNAYFDLHSNNHTLIGLYGEITEINTTCPLEIGDYIQWEHSNPNVLQVHSNRNLNRQQCGQLTIETVAINETAG